VWNAAC